MAEGNVFSKEAVTTAIKFTAQSIAGLVSKEKALETLESLPEDIATIVMEAVVTTAKAQAAAKARQFAKMMGNIASKLSEEVERQ